MGLIILITIATGIMLFMALSMRRKEAHIGIAVATGGGMHYSFARLFFSYITAMMVCNFLGLVVAGLLSQFIQYNPKEVTAFFGMFVMSLSIVYAYILGVIWKHYIFPRGYYDSVNTTKKPPFGYYVLGINMVGWMLIHLLMSFQWGFALV